MERVYVKTLGCKVNTYDSHALENQFKELGYELCTSAEHADITVVNTCSVTAKADREARYLLRRFRRDNPQTTLVVTGCYAQTDSEAVAKIEEVDFVVPNEAKDALAILIHNTRGNQQSPTTFAANKLPIGMTPVSKNRQGHFKTSLNSFPKIDQTSRTRAFLKIQDGCNGFCSYCLIPYARGASRSVAPQKAFDEIKRLNETGVREIVLTGIHLGDYGKENPEWGHSPFADLLDRICQLPNFGRIRISSLEPSEVSPEVLAALAKHRDHICEHFHLPLQSGSDKILQKMRRSYDCKAYETAVMKLREIFPLANIGSDIIPGFPGETDEDHQASLHFVKDLNLAYLHVFPYSKRPNTAASRMPEHLPTELVKQRAHELRVLSRTLLRSYSQKFIGTYCEVLWESSLDGNSRRLGKTRNYLAVASPEVYSKRINSGEVRTARLSGFVDDSRLLAVPIL